MAPLRKVVVHKLAGSANRDESIQKMLLERVALKPGLRLDSQDAELIIGVCEPTGGGQYDASATEVIVADQTLSVFEKIHVLPYKDTFKYNFDFMYNEYIKPFFEEGQSGAFTDGFDFTHDGVRFNIIGVFPEKSYGVAGKNSTIFFEGDPIEREILTKVNAVPFEDGLPEQYRPSRLKLDEVAIKRDFTGPYFEQRSAPVKLGETFEYRGVRFKIVTCTPSVGGGFGRDTELVCQGVALRETFSKSAPSSKAATRPKAKAKVKANAKVAAGGGLAGSGGAEGDGSGCTIS